jgi:23S rRNA (uridine2552-2'-O)-methyltransferase
LKQRFKKVVNVKPPSSRADSSEKFVVATGFRGEETSEDEDDDV